MRISAVVNTYNEEKNLERCLQSVSGFADEIIVVDMHSVDKTVEIAKKYGAKIFQHDYTRYVEPARNFAFSKASGDWIFLIDADEELTKPLSEELKKISGENKIDYVEIPRKNIIFDKWIEHSRWWPDYLVRFFKKGKVSFSEKIHEPPKSEGTSLKLEAREEKALIHYNIQSVSQYLERINRYSEIQALELLGNGYSFKWRDLIGKPANEFLSRYFAGEGYKDGVHGLALGFLQALSELIVYLRCWEKDEFKESDTREVDKVFLKSISDFLSWQQKTASGFWNKIRLKFKSKI